MKLYKIFNFWFVVLLASKLWSQNPIIIPPQLFGPIYDLEMQNGTHQYLDGHDAPSMGFNGDILGPTLVMDAGDLVQINVLNSLGEETTVHWHGLHVAPEDDGGPHSEIDPLETYSPQFEVLDKASTYWYHPHLHHRTFKHVSFGLSGFIIIRDTEEQALNLPRTYGVDDFPLVLQTKSYDPVNHEIRYITGINPGNGLHNRDSLVMVNATIDGDLDVPQQMVRLRLLNGSQQRVFEVGLSDDSDLHQIGSDGGLLSAPYATDRIRLSPGERAEVIVDFSSYSVGQSIELMSYASELPDGIWGADDPIINHGGPGTYNPNPINGADFTMLTFNIIAQTVDPVLSIPATLANVVPIPEEEATVTRTKHLIAGNGSAVRIGNTPQSADGFDIDVINDVITLGTTEIWEISSDTIAYDTTSVDPLEIDTMTWPGQYHPFHIHDVQFFILDRTDGDGNVTLPHPGEQGRKDVVLVNPGETVRFIATFDDFASPVPYMYHCHILPHEDAGMMAQFTVEPPTIYVDNTVNHPSSLEDGSLTYPYNEFSEAYEAASIQHGKIVFLSGGTYGEFPPEITVFKGIELQLDDGSITIE